MKSTAEELMDYCQAKGLGKVGELFYYGRMFDTTANKQEAVIFIDGADGWFERRLDAIAFEHDIVDIQARTDTPGRGYDLLDKIRVCIEGIKGYTSPDKTIYESALAASPPKLLTYSRADMYVHSILIKVMRKTTRT